MIDIDFDALSEKVGGRFKLCTMVIKRARHMLLAQQGISGGKLNSQVIRAALDEIQEGQLYLVEDENEPTEELPGAESAS